MHEWARVVRASRVYPPDFGRGLCCSNVRCRKYSSRSVTVATSLCLSLLFSFWMLRTVSTCYVESNGENCSLSRDRCSVFINLLNLHVFLSRLDMFIAAFTFVWKMYALPWILEYWMQNGSQNEILFRYPFHLFIITVKFLNKKKAHPYLKFTLDRVEKLMSLI